MIDTAIAILIRTPIAATSKAQVKPSSETVNVINDTLPVVIYTLLDTRRTYTDDGAIGIVTAVYNLDIYCNKATDARELADTIRVALDGHKGTTDGTRIERIWFGREKLMQGFLVEGSNQSLARYASEIKVAYRERF